MGKKENTHFFKNVRDMNLAGSVKKKEVTHVSWFFSAMLKTSTPICEKGKFIERNTEKNNETFNIECRDRFIKNIF